MGTKLVESIRYRMGLRYITSLDGWSYYYYYYYSYHLSSIRRGSYFYLVAQVMEDK